MGMLLRACYLVAVLFTVPAFSASPVQVDILTDDDYPPYSYVANGQLKGIYIDLVEQASTLLLPEYQVKITAMPWKRALRRIETGQDFAILPPYNHSGDRKYIHPYSIPLAVESVVTFCRKDVDLNKAFEANNRLQRPIRLGINAGYILLDQKYKTAIANARIQLQENKRTDANLMKLLKGRIDCYANDKLAIEYGLRVQTAQQDPMAMADFVERDFISSQTAHIGYSRVNDAKFPFKADFIEKMDQAIITVLQSQSKQP